MKVLERRVVGSLTCQRYHLAYWVELEATLLAKMGGVGSIGVEVYFVHPNGERERADFPQIVVTGQQGKKDMSLDSLFGQQLNEVAETYQEPGMQAHGWVFEAMPGLFVKSQN